MNNSNSTLNQTAFMFAAEAYAKAFPDASEITYGGMKAAIEAYIGALPCEISLLLDDAAVEAVYKRQSIANRTGIETIIKFYLRELEKKSFTQPVREDQGETLDNGKLQELVADTLEAHVAIQHECRTNYMVAAFQVLKALQPYLKRESVTQWQPIETAPKDGTKIIVINWRGSDPLAHTAWWTSLQSRWENPLTNRELRPTNWMPLERPRGAS